MKKEIVINANKDRSRIAIVEDGQLVELYVETPDNVRSIGNVYLGRIQKVMPAIRAAFVDVGQKQDCFLHFSDLTDNLPQLQALAGEEVPGLDEPVLSLAPAKRVADDDSEPDVEDALEVESSPDEEAKDKKKSSRSRSRRRSRGRGRGRGRRGKGRSEEEEQEESLIEEDRLDARSEEEEQEEGRRRLPPVLDLSSAPKRRPKKAPAPKAAEAASDDAASGDGEAASAPEAPAKGSSRSRSASKRSAAKDSEPTADDTDRQPDDDASTDETADTPKRSRGRRRSSSDDAAQASDADASADDTSTDDASTDEADEKPKRSRRRRRGRRGRGRRGRSEDATGADDVTSDETPSADTSAAEATSRRKSSGRKRSSTKNAEASKDEGSKNETSESEPSGKKGRVSPTGRSRRPSRQSILENSDSVEEAKAEAEEAPAEERPADRSRGRKKPLPATLDLTGASKRSSSTPTEGAEDDGTADDGDEGRSRRRSRGRGKAESDQPTADRAAGDASETDTEDQPKSKRSRGRRGRRDDATADESTKADERKKGERTADDESSREAKKGGRKGRGSSSDKGASDKSSGDRGSRRGGGRSSSGGSKGSGQRSAKIPSNEELLKRGNRIIVKITKEAISTKGPRVSTDLSLAGRFLVLVPAADYVAVSKKIESAKERRRLRTLATSLKPDGFGVIVRTVAEGRDAKSLDQDLKLLIDKWRKIQNKLDQKPDPPVLLYQDVNMVSSIIRDLFSEDYDRILVDDPKVFKNVKAYIKAVAPSMADKVELYKGRTPVYRSMGIEKQVEEAFSKRVNMRGGGYLYIETTEAMHVVDVNSGRAGRGKSQKQNLIDVNVEAAKEVAKQLRLRDLGGIIVVDFIDLRYDRDRRKVTDALKEAFKKDRAVTKLLPMSDFGLVQITRQRLRPSITANATDENGEPLDAAEAAEAAGAGEIVRQGQTTEPVEEAPAAEDRGGRRSERRDDRGRDDRPQLSPEEATPRALAGRLRGWLDHYRATVDDRYKGRPIVVKVHPLFGAYLRRGFPSPLTRWRLALRGITFVLEEDAGVDPLAFEVRDQKSGRSLLKKYSQ